MIMNYPNPALKSVIILLAVTFLFSSCKKDERTVNEWGKLAEAKLNEIKELSTNIPCSEQANVSVQEISTGCSINFYAVRSSHEAEFAKLKKEYFDFLGKQTDAMIKEGYVIDPCFESIWISDQPIRLECKADKVELITAGNVGLGEAKTLAATTYSEIMAIVNAQTCTNSSSWAPIGLLKDKVLELEYIPYLITQDHVAFKKKVSLYNRLKVRISEEEKPADVVRNDTKVERIDCVNGKPVIKLSK